MNKKLREGDVVKLRSGGPEMTVVIIEGKYAAVFWICDRKRPVEEILPVCCLEFVR